MDQNKKEKIVIFLGVPGSGKGTQASLLTDYGFAHISSGALLRELEDNKNADSEDLYLLQEMKKGKLVSDRLIYKLSFQEIIKNLQLGKSIVLDGTIRNLQQAKDFQSFFIEQKMDKNILVMEIRISDEESFFRLSVRKVCPVCGQSFPFVEEDAQDKKCPKCNVSLVVRKDDNPEIIRQRIKEQGNGAIKEIVEFYKELGLLTVIDGKQSINKVHDDVLKIITK